MNEANCRFLEKPDICLNARAIKNVTEIECIRKAHIRDGAALCRFFHWLENAREKNKLSEISIAAKLEDIRKEGKNFYSLSFDTIAGWNSNGAIIHYRADKNSNREIKGSGILLLDSGAQYLDGTTDVTRTIALGDAEAEQKRNFTLVLKGHIALAKQKFTKGNSGSNLDILARKFLWDAGLDYKHGTGHGVGFFLNVHEGPHAINRINKVPLEPGMIISNEPGYYKEGAYGIRIESLVLVKRGRGKDMLEFETLTMAPIDKKLIDKAIMEKEEIDWLNNYHKDVYEKVSPLLNKVEKAWLREATAKL
jgi:Xaa-Pro aminopeptidase